MRLGGSDNYGMLEILAAIPEAIWGAVVGAAGALGAVWLQLRHERGLRERENRLSLKKDVYLQCAEALSSAQGFLASFSRLDLSQREHLATIQGNPGWLNKVHLVAGFSTIEAFTAAGDYFTAAAFELVKHRSELESLNAQLSRKEAERDQLIDHQRQLQTALQNASARTLSEQETQAASHIWNLVQQTQQRLDALFSEIDAEIDYRLKRHLDLIRLSARHSTEFQRVLVPVNVCIRQEIGEPLDQSDYRRLVDSSTKAQEQRLHALLREFEAEPSDENAAQQGHAGDG